MTWTRVRTPTSCGNCRTLLGYGELVALFGPHKHPRCVDCAGVCPWPPLPTLEFRPQGTPTRTRSIGLLPIQERVRDFLARQQALREAIETVPDAAPAIDPIDDYDFDWLAVSQQEG